MRLIDADALKIPSTSVDMFENCRNCRLLDEEQVREIIDNAPSIDIVRCKECRHWWNKYGDSACMIHSDFTVNSDDFCSYGERKESE